MLKFEIGDFTITFSFPQLFVLALIVIFGGVYISGANIDLGTICFPLEKCQQVIPNALTANPGNNQPSFLTVTPQSVDLTLTAIVATQTAMPQTGHTYTPPPPVPPVIITATPVVFTSTTQVDSRFEWQNTGIFIPAGKTVDIQVIAGEWTYWAGTIPYSPGTGNSTYICANATSPNNCAEPIPSVSTGYLIGRIGGDLFPIGNRMSRQANQSGQLELRINDITFNDNDGILTVQITIR